jgi:glycine/D-amino acid oxidase-like deaminating enzyme
MSEDMTFDVVVVGGGVAGLSGAMALGRSRRSVLVIDAGEPRNAPADHAHNYLGREGVNPLELLEIGRGYHQMLGLGRIGTDEAVDALGRERWVFAERALVIVGSERAQDILASWGAVRALAVLDRRRATDLAAAMLSGHWPLPDHDRIGVYTVLGESGDPAHVEALLAQRFEESELWEEFAAMTALARLGAYEGRQRLVELAAGDGYARWSATHTLMLLDEGYLA